MENWILEIETKNHLREIRNPRKARDRDWIVRCGVQVMDGKGKWHSIGHCFFPSDAERAANKINKAIENQKKLVKVENLT